MSSSVVNLHEKRGLLILLRLTDPKLEELAAVSSFFFSFIRALGWQKNSFFSPEVKLGGVFSRCSCSVVNSKGLVLSWWVGSRQWGAWTGRIVSAGGPSAPCGSWELGQKRSDFWLASTLPARPCHTVRLELECSHWQETGSSSASAFEPLFHLHHKILYFSSFWFEYWVLIASSCYSLITFLVINFLTIFVIPQSTISYRNCCFFFQVVNVNGK